MRASSRLAVFRVVWDTQSESIRLPPFAYEFNSLHPDKNGFDMGSKVQFISLNELAAWRKADIASIVARIKQSQRMRNTPRLAAKSGSRESNSSGHLAI